MPQPRVSKLIDRPFAIFALVLCAIFTSSLVRAEAANKTPRVVTSIAPIHALASAVMEGVGAPYLLVPPGVNAHGYALRPSDARALANADVVFWLGAGLERFLDKPLKGGGRRALSVRLSAYVAGLPVREGGVWGNHDEHTDSGGHKIDPHVWLDPENAKRMAAEIAKRLSAFDSENSSVYESNATALAVSIDQAARDVENVLAPVKTIPYVVFHDAYQYFESRFDMNAVGSIMINPERPPGAARISDVRRKIRETGAACVFHEPQFKPKLVETVIRGGAAKSAPLDPIGVGISPGPRAYQQLLLSLAGQLRACLAR
ncbi:MAG: zinc ABC transporter solute-binding protein [Rhodospirillaceae bacterium]|nr:zinc ABC transporter solute-binding protein [Rhodospirillaceae bacterium]MBT5664405.1 zinc ABC transporter solute-binding protein [Rhodospirillaceae bacterium]MBT5810112.1 zinc ABC transporter solute-binding protein [Rhodospirillaceae bacterium]